LQAERDVGVAGKLIAFTVTYSYANFYGVSGLGQMEMLYACMKDPAGKGLYNPKNDISWAYLGRFVNAFNTYSPANDIRGQFLSEYSRSVFWKGKTQIPVFVAEYHAPSHSQVRDLPDMLSSSGDGHYPFFFGYCFFEFQARYDKAQNAEHEMTFGMFGFNTKCTIGEMIFFGNKYPIHALYSRRGIEGHPVPSAVAKAFGGDSARVNDSCTLATVPVALSAQAQPEERTEGFLLDVAGSMTTYRDINAWGLSADPAQQYLV